MLSLPASLEAAFREALSRLLPPDTDPVIRDVFAIAGAEHLARNAEQPLSLIAALHRVADRENKMPTQTASVHDQIEQITTRLHGIDTKNLTLDDTQAILCGLGGDQGLDLISALAHLIKRITDPNTNPSLRDLPAGTLAAVREHIAAVAADLDAYASRQYVAHAVGLIEHSH